MNIKLLKSCVIGVGKTGKKGQKVTVEDQLGKQLVLSGKAEKVESKTKETP